MNLTMVEMSTSLKLSTTPLPEARAGELNRTPSRSRDQRVCLRYRVKRASTSADIIVKGHRASVPDHVKFEPALSLEGDERLQRLVGGVDREVVQPQQHIAVSDADHGEDAGGLDLRGPKTLHP